MAALEQVRVAQEAWLAAVPDGISALILQVLHPPEVSKQLAHLGVVPGAQLLVRRSASFGGPLFVEIHGASVLLARKLAKKILVRLLP